MELIIGGVDYKEACQNVKDFTMPDACFGISALNDTVGDEEW